jgi:hypothetical protein
MQLLLQICQVGNGIYQSWVKTMQIWTTQDDKVYTITKYCRRGRLPNDLQVTERMVSHLK